MSDEEVDDILPEDDSIFEHLDAERATKDVSTDSILDDSFSSVICSTPADKSQPSPRPTRAQTRARRPLLVISPPRTLGNRASRPRTPDPGSPRPTTRSQARCDSPSVFSPPSTRRNQIIGADSSSPRPATRSQASAGSPSVRPLRQSSRSRARECTPEPASPRPATRSQTRVESPSAGSPRPTTRSQARAGTPDTSSPRPVTRSQAGVGSPSVRSPRVSSPSTSPRPTTRSQARTEPEVASQNNSGVSALPQRLPAATPRFPVKLKCPLCPSVFANETTLATHKKRHALKRAFARAATEAEFLSEMPVLVVNSLEKILKEPLIGTMAVSVNKFAQVVLDTMKSRDEFHNDLFEYLSDQLYRLLKDQNSIFSSNLQYVLLVGVNKLLNSSEFRHDFRGYILGLTISEPPDSVETLNVFTTNFMMQLSFAAILFYVKKIHGFSATQEIRRKRSDDNVDSTTFLQMAYHIGGSVVSGYLYKGAKYKAPSWKTFVVILRNKFLRVQSVGNACADEVREFTESRDRGGLNHISQEALDFFVVLFDLLMSLEGDDGSLPENVIDDHVLTSDIVLCLWDDLVGSDLDEESSMDFLEQMARTCRNVVMKGIMKRKLNEHLKKAISSVTLRSRLAT